jgi:hypothetical protein
MNARLSGVSNSYLELWLTRYGLWSGQLGLACRPAMQSQEHAIKVGDFSSCTTVAGGRMRGTRTIDIAPSLGQRGIPAPECGTEEADALVAENFPPNILQILGRPFLARQIADAQLAHVQKKRNRKTARTRVRRLRSRATRWT